MISDTTKHQIPWFFSIKQICIYTQHTHAHYTYICIYVCVSVFMCKYINIQPDHCIPKLCSTMFNHYYHYYPLLVHHEIPSSKEPMKQVPNHPWCTSPPSHGQIEIVAQDPCQRLAQICDGADPIAKAPQVLRVWCHGRGPTGSASDCSWSYCWMLSQTNGTGEIAWMHGMWQGEVPCPCDMTGASCWCLLKILLMNL